jgi:uncharacterized membrane protein YsdA (DUF1294 family)
MTRFVVRRLLVMIALLFAITVITFLMFVVDRCPAATPRH